ncbi:hypothetical protein [Bacillus piscicola]|uniref:hypothetical protein n=1 Tax=Bacillus piscicola TaxID=1632684 RepID=UPI001F08F17B|nr:hypothetical protein [Bacillus piscicola]
MAEVELTYVLLQHPRRTATYNRNRTMGGRQRTSSTHRRSNTDGLNYLAGKTIGDVNKQACQATLQAHTDGDVPNVVLSIPTLDEYHIGSLFYFFQKACAISSYLLDVHPFNQPGVEAYKQNMAKLLEKPESQKHAKKLQES